MRAKTNLKLPPSACRSCVGVTRILLSAASTFFCMFCSCSYRWALASQRKLSFFEFAHSTDSLLCLILVCKLISLASAEAPCSKCCVIGVSFPWWNFTANVIIWVFQTKDSKWPLICDTSPVTNMFVCLCRLLVHVQVTFSSLFHGFPFVTLCVISFKFFCCLSWPSHCCLIWMDLGGLQFHKAMLFFTSFALALVKGTCFCIANLNAPCNQSSHMSEDNLSLSLFINFFWIDGSPFLQLNKVSLVLIIKKRPEVTTFCIFKLQLICRVFHPMDPKFWNCFTHGAQQLVSSFSVCLSSSGVGSRQNQIVSCQIGEQPHRDGPSSTQHSLLSLLLWLSNPCPSCWWWFSACLWFESWASRLFSWLCPCWISCDQWLEDNFICFESESFLCSSSDSRSHGECENATNKAWTVLDCSFETLPLLTSLFKAHAKNLSQLDMMSFKVSSSLQSIKPALLKCSPAFGQTDASLKANAIWCDVNFGFWNAAHHAACFSTDVNPWPDGEVSFQSKCALFQWDQLSFHFCAPCQHWNLHWLLFSPSVAICCGQCFLRQCFPWCFICCSCFHCCWFVQLNWLCCWFSRWFIVNPTLWFQGCCLCSCCRRLWDIESLVDHCKTFEWFPNWEVTDKWFHHGRIIHKLQQFWHCWNKSGCNLLTASFFLFLLLFRLVGSAEGFLDTTGGVFLPAGFFPCGSSTFASCVVGASFFFFVVGTVNAVAFDDTFDHNNDNIVAFAATTCQRPKVVSCWVHWMLVWWSEHWQVILLERVLERFECLNMCTLSQCKLACKCSLSSSARTSTPHMPNKRKLHAVLCGMCCKVWSGPVQGDHSMTRSHRSWHMHVDNCAANESRASDLFFVWFQWFVNHVIRERLFTEAPVGWVFWSVEWLNSSLSPDRFWFISHVSTISGKKTVAPPSCACGLCDTGFKLSWTKGVSAEAPVGWIFQSRVQLHSSLSQTNFEPSHTLLPSLGEKQLHYPAWWAWLDGETLVSNSVEPKVLFCAQSDHLQNTQPTHFSLTEDGFWKLWNILNRSHCFKWHTDTNWMSKNLGDCKNQKTVCRIEPKCTTSASAWLMWMLGWCLQGMVKKHQFWLRLWWAWIMDAKLSELQCFHPELCRTSAWEIQLRILNWQGVQSTVGKKKEWKTKNAFCFFIVKTLHALELPELVLRTCNFPGAAMVFRNPLNDNGWWHKVGACATNSFRTIWNLKFAWKRQLWTHVWTCVWNLHMKNDSWCMFRCWKFHSGVQLCGLQTVCSQTWLWSHIWMHVPDLHPNNKSGATLGCTSQLCANCAWLLWWQCHQGESLLCGVAQFSWPACDFLRFSKQSGLPHPVSHG